MYVRQYNGKLVNIEKGENDTAYYSKLLEVKFNIKFEKPKTTLRKDIINFVQKK